MKHRLFYAVVSTLVLAVTVSGAEKTAAPPAADPTLDALLKKDVPALVKAIDAGGNPNARTADGKPLIMLADAATAKVLLDRGADPNATDAKGDTGLHAKAWSFLVQMYLGGFGDREASGTIVVSPGASGEAAAKLELDQDPYAMWRKDDATASLVPLFEYIDTLITHGGNINAKNAQGNTPLDEAVAMPKLGGVTDQQIADSSWYKFLRGKGAKYASELPATTPK